MGLPIKKLSTDHKLGNISRDTGCKCAGWVSIVILDAI
jgi:hypothetical protein